MSVPSPLTTGALSRAFRLGRDQRLFAAILVISVAAVFGSFGAIRKAEHYLLKAEASATAIHWARFLEEKLTDLDEILSSGLVSARDQQIFHFAGEAGRVSRYQVIRPDGMTALSSWAGDFGKSHTEAALTQAIETRKPVVNLVQGVRFDQATVESEAYVPIVRYGRVIGAIKVYVDMTQRAADLRSIGTTALLALIGLLSVIGVLCGSVVWHNIRDRNRELREIRESRERISAAEQTIRALNRRNEMILGAAGEGIYGLALDDTITFINPAGARMLGWEPQDLIGWPQHTIFPDSKSDSEAHSADHAPALPLLSRGTDPRKSDEVFWRRDGTAFPVEYTSAPIWDEHDHLSGSVVVFRDITERKQAEHDLARQAAELARSNTELEQFAYVASHDLQEPLRKIQAFGDRLKARSADAMDEGARDYLERMLSATQRMRILISDLLMLSRAGTSEQALIEVDLGKVVREVVADLEVRIQALGAEVEIGDLPTIDADPTQMRQLFQNLISNALKFQRPDVRPVVRVRAQGPARPETSSRGFGAGRQLCQILVEDNGIGFDERHVDRIFVVFRRLHGRGQYEGTGVGLAICRKIVERHNGTITAKSRSGEGATFILTLPVKQKKGRIAA